MRTVTIYGASDDLIEVDGDLRDEFDCYDATGYLAFSDGTVVSAGYCTDDRGVWNIRVARQGTAKVERTEGEGPDSEGPGSENYTDRITLTGDLRWVKHRRTLADADRLAEGRSLGPKALARAIGTVAGAIERSGEEDEMEAWEELRTMLEK